MTIPSWVHVADAAVLAARLVDEVAPVAAAAAEARGVWSLAIPGGSVVDRLIPALAHARLPWDRAHVFWCDERLVPPGDLRSNYHALRNLGETVAQLRAATLHPMPASGSDEAGAIARYAREIAQVAGRPPQLDVVLLGMGEDGHVASLFPGRPALAEDASIVVVEDASPKPPPRRLSLTLPVLVNASLTVVAAFGPGKRGAVRASLEEDSALPAARVLRRARRPLLLLDAEAASGLG